MGSIQEPVGQDITVPYDVEPLSRERPQLYGWQNTSDTGYSIDEIPSGLKKHLRIIAVGAGASGISLAKFADDQLENAELIIFDKNDEVGGTWTENRYPYCLSNHSTLTCTDSLDEWLRMRYPFGHLPVHVGAEYLVEVLLRST